MFHAPLAGFIGGDIKHQALDNGNYVARFRVGVNDRYRDAKGEWKENETVWVTCQAWGDLARRVAHQFASGTPVVVLGQWKQSNYEKEGVKKSTRFVEVTHIGEDLAIPPREKTTPPQPTQSAQPEPTVTSGEETPAVTNDVQEENPFA